MSADALTVASAVIEAYNDHDLARYASLHTPDSSVTFAGFAGSAGLPDWLATLRRMFAAIPDLRVAPVTMLADARSAIVEVIQTGTNTGVLALDDGEREMLGIADSCVEATGRRIEVSGVVVLTTDGDGHVSTQRHHWPRWWWYESLGLVTVTATPTASLSTG